MVDEEKPVDDGEKEQPKRAGRPAKRTARSEPAEEQPKDTATEDGEKEPAQEESDTEEVVDNSTAPDGRIVQEGEEYEIETREVNGVKVAAENTYLKKRLPKSSRFTYILLAVEGAPQ